MLGTKAKPFKLSRSKIDLFVDCPRCFYLDRRLKIPRPPMLPFNLNIAVDQLLKNEFDTYRKEQKKHPIMEMYKLDLLPFQHPDLDIWRENFKGIQAFHEPTQFLITGAVDDIWVGQDHELYIVDYKATSRQQPITGPEHLYSAYKRQAEVYQWLFRQNGFKVSPKAYFVYCNGVKNKNSFNRHLEFNVSLIAYEGDDSWVSTTLIDIADCLGSGSIPPAKPTCPYCSYAKATKDLN